MDDHSQKLFEALKFETIMEHIKNLVCVGCKLPYPQDPSDPEEKMKPFPICDDCLERLKPIYQHRRGGPIK